MAIAGSRLLHFLVLLAALFASASAHANHHRDHRARHSKKPSRSDNFHVDYQWRVVDFELPPEINVRKLAKNKNYIADHVYISKIKIYNDTMFMAMPKLKNGVISTLGFMPLYLNDSVTITDQYVQPFPSYELNTEPNCDGFKSVHSFEIDSEGIMWVIDNGIIDNQKHYHRSNSAVFCRPSLKLVDLNNNNNYTIYEFPTSVLNFGYYLKDIVVDDYDGGYAYITDNSKDEPGIVVYSRRENKSWKFKGDKTMIADLRESITNDLPISNNINGIALGTRFLTADEITDRCVFYSTLGSFKFHAVNASWLRNESLVEEPFMSAIVGDRRDFSDGMTMDENGFLYYGSLLNRTIFRWNSSTTFPDSQREVVAFDTGNFFWIERFAFDEKNNLYVVITRFGEYAMHKVNHNKLNYKIIRIDVGARSYLYGSDINLEDSATNRGNVMQVDWVFMRMCTIMIFLIDFFHFSLLRDLANS